MDKVEELVEETPRNSNRKGPTNASCVIRDPILLFFLKMASRTPGRPALSRVSWDATGA
jgi:hypothetical protein